MTFLSTLAFLFLALILETVIPLAVALTFTLCLVGYWFTIVPFYLWPCICDAFHKSLLAPQM